MTSALVKKVATACMTTALAMGVVVAAVPSANANRVEGGARVHAQSCASLGYTNPTSYRLDDNGKGKVRVYFSSSRNSNCIDMTNETGGRRRMILSAWLSVPEGPFGEDQGDYSSHAGAITLPGAGGKCVNFEGSMFGAGGGQVLRYGIHCG